MIIVKGEMLKNKRSHDLYTVKKSEDSKIVMLEHEKGYTRIWLQRNEIESYFEKIEGGNVE